MSGVRALPAHRVARFIALLRLSASSIAAPLTLPLPDDGRRVTMVPAGVSLLDESRSSPVGSERLRGRHLQG